MNARLLRFALNLYPPYLGAGIRVRHLAADWTSATVQLRLGLLNRNYYGAHFGGSLYAMTDPFFALLAIHRLGPDYFVAHKSGMIDYLAPAKGVVTARFDVTDAQIAEIKLKTTDGTKYLPTFSVDIFDAQGQLVARATHMLHVRRKTPVAVQVNERVRVD